MFFKTHTRWVKSISVKEFQDNFEEGTPKLLAFEEEEVLFVKIGSQLRVFEQYCPHQKASLKNSVCEDGSIVCPWHKYAFCLKTGRDLSTSGNALKVYQTKFENDYWYVGQEVRLPFWMDPI